MVGVGLDTEAYWVIELELSLALLAHGGDTLETAIGTLEELQTVIVHVRHHDGVVRVIKGNAPRTFELAVRISSLAIAEH